MYDTVPQAGDVKELRILQSYESEWWQHIVETPSHHERLQDLLQEAGFSVSKGDFPEHAFALLLGATAAREQESVPLCGLSTDRRTLQHVGEIFREDAIKTLMCFICGCKHLQIDRNRFNYTPEEVPRK